MSINKSFNLVKFKYKWKQIWHIFNKFDTFFYFFDIF